MKMKLEPCIKVCHFTWQREERFGGEECWKLVGPEGVATLTYWCLVNYGGEPVAHDPFSGWRLTSGGPFTRAGGWRSRAAAMKGVVPFLLLRIRTEVKVRLAEAQKSAEQLAQLEKEMG